MFSDILKKKMNEMIIYDFLNICTHQSAPGLQEAREKLQLSQMSKEEQAAYRRYWDNRVILADQTARGEGKLEGKSEGLEDGRAEGRAKGKSEAMRSIALAMNRQESRSPVQ